MKFDQLAAYLLAQSLCDASKFVFGMATAEVKPIWKKDANGLLVGNLQYTAAYSLGDVSSDNTQWLMVFLLSWLNENDDNRQTYSLGNPSLQISPTTADLVNIEVSVDFVDPVYLVTDPNGRVEIMGETWGFGVNDLWIAETFQLVYGKPGA